MSKSPLFVRSLAAVASCLALGAASAAPAIWTDWTSISATTAVGTLGGVSVTATTNNSTVMNGPSQTACGFNWWTGTAYTNGNLDNGPTACEQVALSNAVSITVTFGSAVNDLYMALLSVGQPNVQVTLDFDQAFTIDSQGAGYWGSGPAVMGAGDTLAMNEFHGVVRFAAPVTSMTFTSTGENWHAFTFGTVPEPGTLALVGAALLGAGVISRRRRSL